MVIATIAFAALGSGDDDPDSARPAPSPAPAPPPDDSGEAIEQECLPNDPSCWTDRYGGNVDAAEDFLEGLLVGPGGLKERSAGPDGFAVSAIGNPLPMVEATETLTFSELVGRSGTCSIHLDPERRLLAVTDPGDVVTAFHIGNVAVETDEEIRIDSTLDELQSAYPDATVDETASGWVAATPPQAGWDEINEVENERHMVFWLSEDERVTHWAVGRSEYLASPTLCPE